MAGVSLSKGIRSVCWSEEGGRGSPGSELLYGDLGPKLSCGVQGGSRHGEQKCE